MEASSLEDDRKGATGGVAGFLEYVEAFEGFGTKTERSRYEVDGVEVPAYANAFWTSKQRAGHSIHEVSYRACYKPQLPRFFIEYLSPPNGSVYDPFMGRGTTLVEAQMLGRRAMGNDINPLGRMLAEPRLNPPSFKALVERVEGISLFGLAEPSSGLAIFFHPETLREIEGWRGYFRERLRAGSFDYIDDWLRMVVCNRLTGHSSGFFSVYTLPPNQATSMVAQEKINLKRKQVPEYRDTKRLVLKKSKQLLRDGLPEGYARGDALLMTRSADDTPELEDGTVDLVVTSPPFLDVVNYEQDNWMRNWFCEVVFEVGKLWQLRSIDTWRERMVDSLKELKRVLKSGGVVAFEVGEVRNAKVLLEKEVIRAGLAAGLVPRAVVLNIQEFTKTAQVWGVSNNGKGTNSNRIILLEKTG